MRRVASYKRTLLLILIVFASGLLTTACSGGKEFKVHEVDAIADGPGFLTGDSGDATFDPKTGEFKVGNKDAIARANQRSIEIRRRRSRARRRQEGATGN